MNRLYSLHFLYISLLLLLLIHVSVSAQEYRGRVVAISDGDTFTLLTPGKQQKKVRLSEIDTPESAQPFGTRAKQALSDLIFGKDVIVVQESIDRYGRLVGHVYVADLHVNRRMVQQGMAWVYRQYLKDKSLLEDEQLARENKSGLWSLPSTEQVPPWEWRRGSRAATPSTAEQTGATAGKDTSYRCGQKTRCSEMTSCEEALYYLKECGISSLDGDKDGMPCESLCK